jgi:hypothetical protein
LVNKNATLETKMLKNYLDSIYGKKIISGQVDDKYLQFIKDNTGGKEPAMMGYDYSNIEPCKGQTNKDTEKAIKWVKERGGIAQFQWHWASPKSACDYYTKNNSDHKDGSEFDIAYAMNNPNSEDYKLIIRDMDLVAEKIKQMQAAGVPILWRPLHEAEGTWFWWGAKGGDALKKLWNLMYDRYTNHHKLNNIIWVWNSYGFTKENWYPGDNTVDIISYDYEDNNSWNSYQQLFGGRGKLFGLGEEGRLPDPNNFNARHWLYFLTWAYMIEDGSKNSKDWINKVYNDSRTVTLSDLKLKGLYGNAGEDKILFDTNGDGFETAMLDASGSNGNGANITSYTWMEGNTLLATGEKASVELALGTHKITLTVKDSNGNTTADDLTVIVKKPSLSLNKAVTASSVETGQPVQAAVDGNPATRWSSLYTDPQWIQIDLGSAKPINQIVLSWETASAKDYTIAISNDGTSWTNLVTKTGMANGARVDDLTGLSANARYLRLNGTARTSAYGYSLFEFEVY